ncbi:hypothetical protein [Methylobacterium haplocladii]|uniref:Uncharacterized protein n=1 Tax=Methylobacterium haplocladii TaxID=1176176 RepID=A0A512ISG8_9HYPH|nr:hypothetical protein [Methylobacterium haplocladii]GEP00654.1 hypothetical protein MHA02_30410 [Methylobacterium haplocladii]GJD85417.1 hypothetical protein HPGCJGGD_3306 [Methylobacterium haplocladii]GLS57802.1 hypothetical protein GCM10007887_04580 [Methylobacterium haplocladii]
MTANTDDLIKAALQAPSEDIARSILSAAGMSNDELAKSITTQTGLVAYDLQAPAKNLYPVNTPIRNRLPRVGGGIGVATNWKAIDRIIGSGYDAQGWVPEGQRSGQMSYATSNKAASYVTIGEEDGASFEAINAGRGFEDVKARMTMRMLQKMMLKEENALLGGNATLQLGTPSAPVASASGSTGAIAAATYSVIVVALSFEGCRGASIANGIPTTKVINGADGKTFTLYGGSSNKSAAGSVAVTSGQSILASVAPIMGAMGYAWFVGPSGSEVLQAITYINSVSLSTLRTGTQPATAITADNSANPNLAFDGLLTTAFKAGANGAAYVNQLATGTAGIGTKLTSSGRGSCNEVDAMLQGMWDAYQVSPSVLYVNSQETTGLTNAVLTGSSAPLLHYMQDPQSGGVKATAGGTIEYYFNPYSTEGGSKIPVKIHPALPPGTMIGWAENLPIQYQANEVPNVAEVKVRQDYYEIDWPITTRQRQVGVYAEEVLAVYAPFAMGIVTNIAKG